MNVKDLRLQVETYSNLAANATDVVSEARFSKLHAVFKSKYDAARLKGIKDRVESKGVDYDAWEMWAKSIYLIHVTPMGTRVKSVAKEWTEERSWEVADEIAGLEKIEQLIGYKIADRKRGVGDMSKDLSGFDSNGFESPK